MKAQVDSSLENLCAQNDEQLEQLHEKQLPLSRTLPELSEMNNFGLYLFSPQTMNDAPPVRLAYFSKAIELLKSSIVKDASSSKIYQFLLSKGFTMQEINAAILKINEQQPRKFRLLKYLFIVSVTTAACTAYAATAVKVSKTLIQNWIINFYRPFLINYGQSLNNIKTQTMHRSGLVVQCLDHYKSVLDCSQKEKSISKSLKELTYSESKNLDKALMKLREYKERQRPELHSAVESFDAFASAVRSELYHTSSNGPEKLSSLKSEIRGLKGMLLSRRNFPAATKMSK
jgi:hypothetical protein